MAYTENAAPARRGDAQLSVHCSSASPSSVTQAADVPLCLIATLHAIRRRSSALTGQSMSHSRQYASMIPRDSIKLISLPRVCPCCNRWCPQAGQAEAKTRRLFILSDVSVSFPDCSEINTVQLGKS